MKKVIVVATLAGLIFVTNPAQALWLMAQGVECYAAKNHNKKKGWVCDPDKGWRKDYNKSKKGA